MYVWCSSHDRQLADHAQSSSFKMGGDDIVHAASSADKIHIWLLIWLQSEQAGNLVGASGVSEGVKALKACHAETWRECFTVHSQLTCRLNIPKVPQSTMHNLVTL
jgi:hypothetical protein